MRSIYVFVLRTCIIFLWFNSTCCYLKEKPDFMKTCYRKESNFEVCSKQSVQAVFANLKNGIPEIGIKPMEPFRMPELRVLQGDNGPVTVNASLTNVIIRGLSNITVASNSPSLEHLLINGYKLTICEEVCERYVNSRVNFTTFSFTTDLHIPYLRIEGKYRLNGRILLLPLNGNGKAWFEPRDMKVITHQDITVVKRDDHKFFNLNDVHVDFSVGSMRMYLGNLYNGRRILEESTNQYINTHWRPVMESLKPILAKTTEDIIFTVMKQLFDNTPAEFFIGDV